MQRKTFGLSNLSILLAIVALPFASTLLMANEWENPQETYGADWDCSRMEVGNPTYDTCKRCLGSTNGTFYWIVPEGQTQFDRRLEYYKGRCVLPDGSDQQDGSNSNTPAASDFGSDNNVYENTAPNTNTTPIQTPHRWGAIAVAELKASGSHGPMVAMATVFAGSEQDAIDQALANCRVYSNKSKLANTCDVKVTWSKGCWFSALSKNSSSGAWAFWAPTKEQIYQACSDQGVQCDRFAGGCL